MAPGLARAAGHVLEVSGTEEIKKKYLESMYTGKWGGTMCLTESSAGLPMGVKDLIIEFQTAGYFDYSHEALRYQDIIAIADFGGCEVRKSAPYNDLFLAAEKHP